MYEVSSPNRITIPHKASMGIAIHRSKFPLVREKNRRPAKTSIQLAAELTESTQTSRIPKTNNPNRAFVMHNPGHDNYRQPHDFYGASTRPTDLKEIDDHRHAATSHLKGSRPVLGQQPLLCLTNSTRECATTAWSDSSRHCLSKSRKEAHTMPQDRGAGAVLTSCQPTRSSTRR